MEKPEFLQKDVELLWPNLHRPQQTVTYRYRERTPAGLPRFASFLRVREAE